MKLPENGGINSHTIEKEMIISNIQQTKSTVHIEEMQKCISMTKFHAFVIYSKRALYALKLMKDKTF